MELKQVLESGDLDDDPREDEGAQRGGAAARAGALRGRAGRAADRGPGNGGQRRRTEDEVVEDADYEVIDEDEAAKKA